MEEEEKEELDIKKGKRESLRKRERGREKGMEGGKKEVKGRKMKWVGTKADTHG